MSWSNQSCQCCQSCVVGRSWKPLLENNFFVSVYLLNSLMSGIQRSPSFNLIDRTSFAWLTFQESRGSFQSCNNYVDRCVPFDFIKGLIYLRRPLVCLFQLRLQLQKQISTKAELHVTFLKWHKHSWANCPIVTHKFRGACACYNTISKIKTNN